MARKNADAEAGGRDWRETLFLPKTDFPMKAGLPRREPELLERWARIGTYERMRADAKGREKYILHDGPPYANANLHIGHALNKILKDVVTRSQQMMGKDSNYVPGWDCHGLPIEWMIEEKYRAKGQNRSKDDVPAIEFRQECREHAEYWIDEQRKQFKRMGVDGDWDHPYTTMTYEAEATIAEELMKFAMNGTLYRGSKPVMWSVVERTALAEAEVEYHDHQSDTIWVKFPVRAVQSVPGAECDMAQLQAASVVIWTTTPWTIPGNRAISYNPNIAYGLYEVVEAPDDNWARPGDKFILADKLAAEVSQAARIGELRKLCPLDPASIQTCSHPFEGLGYDFPVRLYPGDHVTNDAGTGFVHTAPGHGADDYNVFEENKKQFEKDGIAEVPHTVGEDGFYFKDVPIFGGDRPRRVIDDRGKFADANKAVIDKLVEVGALIARGRVKHQYPHSWRSKAPVIFRNTPQWFIAIDTKIKVPGKRKKMTIREMALEAIDATRFVPMAGQRRLRSMIEQRPDWVVSRQRVWGVPITVFRHAGTGEVIPNADFERSEELIGRIGAAFRTQGADAWFKRGARSRLLKGLVDDPKEWEQVADILDVWFDSGSTHAFVLEQRDDLQWPASLYLEGSDQHRGWFHSSLLESCGTRGRAPYEAVLTHGFTMDEEGRKMSKSLGNTVDPADVIRQSGADILRLWVMSTDYAEDQRIGPEILKSNVDAYRKLRNTFRFLLGSLHHYSPDLQVKYKDMPELERYILNRMAALDKTVRKAYDDFDFRRIYQDVFNFATLDLSAFYFDIRKDALYCEPFDSVTRRACMTVLDEVFSCLTAWLAPMLVFTCEEVWLSRYPSDEDSVHFRQMPDIPRKWRDKKLEEKWAKIRKVRRVVTGALEVERREKRIGSSLEAAPTIHVWDKDLREALAGVDLAELCITSGATLRKSKPKNGGFRVDEIDGVAVVAGLAQGRKCQRSWKISKDVGKNKDFPDLTPRDAEAVRQFDQRAAIAAE